MRDGTLGERRSEHARQRDLQPNPRRLGLALAREWCGRSAGDGRPLPLGVNAFELSKEERSGMMIWTGCAREGGGVRRTGRFVPGASKAVDGIGGTGGIDTADDCCGGGGEWDRARATGATGDVRR